MSQLANTMPEVSAINAPSREGQSVREALPAILPMLRLRALRLCRDRMTAEDLVQDTIERALRFETTYEPNTNLRAWLYQVLLSVFITRCRRVRREHCAMKWLAADPASWTKPEGSATGMDALLPSVEMAISALPADFAAVIRLVDIGESSYHDAAQKLRVPVGTVMSRLFRARRQLRDRLRTEPVPVASAA